MILKWLAGKTKTDWGVFSKSEMLDSNLMGIPKETCTEWLSQGLAKVAQIMTINPKQEWDDEEKIIKPIEGE